MIVALDAALDHRRERMLDEQRQVLAGNQLVGAQAVAAGGLHRGAELIALRDAVADEAVSRTRVQCAGGRAEAQEKQSMTGLHIDPFEHRV